jgi:fluoroacetyl-CoA thioesterase
MPLPPGTLGTAELAVTGIDLASILNQRPDDDFPPVFATTRMIGLMELAASRVLHPLLKEGEVSVGVGVDIMHTAATPIGARVTAEALFTGMDGKLYVFEVTVRDPGGEVGRGIHKRAIVSAERLRAGASRRCG